MISVLSEITVINMWLLVIVSLPSNVPVQLVQRKDYQFMTFYFSRLGETNCLLHIYISIRYGATLTFIWSHVSNHLMNESPIFACLLSLFFISTAP